MRFVLVHLFYLFTTIFVLGQNFNASYLYDRHAEVKIKHQLASNDVLCSVFLKVSLNASQSISDYNLDYKIFSSENLNSPKDEFQLRTDMVHSEADDYHFHLQFPNPRIPSTLSVTVKNLNTLKEYIFDIKINSKINFPAANFHLMKRMTNLPVYENYIHEDDSVFIKSLDHNINQFFFYHYDFEFPIARSPMTTKKERPERSLKIDTLLRVSPNQAILLPLKGLYFIQSDTNNLAGTSIIMEHNKFPKTAKLGNLVQQVIYLSTNKEYSKLMLEKDKKKAFDSYWVNMAQSKQVARTIIKGYYRHIAEANDLFTNYKAGWQTDKGMIYTILGKPDEVFFRNNEEIWLYKKSSKKYEFKFTFAKVKNIFTDYHYELIRDPKFRRAWYENINLWRTGINER